MSNSNLVPKIKERATLYFDQWHHCLRGYQPEIHCLRVLDHGWIDLIMGRRQEWARVRQPGSWSWGWPYTATEEEDRENLHRMCDFLQQDQRPRKIMLSGSYFYIYTNDVGLIQDIASRPWLDRQHLQWTEIHQVGQPGAIPLRESVYSKRTYFRNQLLDSRQKQTLCNLLANQQDIRLGPALAQWTKNTRPRIHDYYFIDHEHDGILTMLSLISPKLIRRTLPIVTDK